MQSDFSSKVCNFMQPSFYFFHFYPQKISVCFSSRFLLFREPVTFKVESAFSHFKKIAQRCGWCLWLNGKRGGTSLEN